LIGNGKAMDTDKPFFGIALWSRKLPLSWSLKTQTKERGRSVMADPERTAFIRTLESMTTFIETMEDDLRMDSLAHLGQGNRVNSCFQKILSSADNAGDVGLMISHRTRGLQDSLFDLSAAVREKIEEHIAFSDQATNEVELLCRQSKTFLKASIDFLLTDNPVLLTWLDTKQKECKKSCEECATGHEERLIEGICTQTAAMIYLDILDGFKGIYSQTTNIIWLLAGLCGIYEAKYGIN